LPSRVWVIIVSTLGDSTLIILFSQNVEIFKNFFFFSKEQDFVKEKLFLKLDGEHVILTQMLSKENKNIAKRPICLTSYQQK
jgi:hypothetical protein